MIATHYSLFQKLRFPPFPHPLLIFSCVFSKSFCRVTHFTPIFNCIFERIIFTFVIQDCQRGEETAVNCYIFKTDEKKRYILSQTWTLSKNVVPRPKKHNPRPIGWEPLVYELLFCMVTFAQNRFFINLWMDVTF